MLTRERERTGKIDIQTNRETDREKEADRQRWWSEWS